MNGEPIRKIGRESAIIVMPTPEIILDQDFDYGKYAEQFFIDAMALRKGIYQGYLKELKDVDLSNFYNTDNEEEIKNNMQEQEKQLHKMYSEKIFELQHQYEEAFKKGYADQINEDITKAMQYVTSDYVTTLDTIDDIVDLDNLSGKTK